MSKKYLYSLTTTEDLADLGDAPYRWELYVDGELIAYSTKSYRSHLEAVEAANKTRTVNLIRELIDLVRKGES